MRTAFNPTSGPLTNMDLPYPERERIADLFAGSVGIFKNPLESAAVGQFIQPHAVLPNIRRTAPSDAG